jgi:RNA polymerase sigma-70 factor (ECF subfamily)
MGTPTTEDDAIDRGLIEGIKQGTPGAWNDLVKRYQDRIYSVCLKLTSNRDLAADLAQDTMVKLVQHIDRYDGRCLFSTWVYRVTFNTCLTRLRAEKLRRMAPLDGAGNVELRSGDGVEVRGGGAGGGGRGSAGSGGLGIRSVGTTGGGGAERELGGAERVEYGEARRALREAVQRLAPEHASVLILRDGHGLEYQQIADALEISVGTVKSRLFRARAALRDLMEGGEAKD